MKLTVWIICWLGLSLPLAAAELSAGIQIKQLIPNNLPDFRSPVPVYGAQFGWGTKPHGVELMASHGAADGVSVYLAELSYLHEIETPFFDFFLIGGVHWLYYSAEVGTSARTVGAHVGPGVVLRFGKTLMIPLNVRLLLQENSLVSVGGGLVFRI